ncbi:MAG: ATP-binding protein [Phenylobacterium sp.]|nr:ATP-binding protein [Phenylobacterium sp.]
MTDFIATSVARGLIARMQPTHDRRRVSVFAGPPGIGKTTAIDEFARRKAGEIAVVKVARRNAREVLVLQHALEALRRLTSSSYAHAPSSVWDLRNDLFGEICAWSGVEAVAARRGEYDVEGFPRLTVVFDEAQNLSREAIEALRFWNDRDRCYAPFPVGLIFVGNSEFSLATKSGPDNVISAAVADRALYIQTLVYDDVADDDLELFIEARCVLQPGALAAVVRAFRGPRSLRSFRRLADLIDNLTEGARGAPISVEDVRRHLTIA